MRHRNLSDDECMGAVLDVVQDRNHHTFPNILDNAEFVPDEDDDGNDDEWPTDLGKGQVRRGLALLQDTLTDDIYWCGVCDDQSHDGQQGRPDCFGQWVYWLTSEVSLGRIYALRRAKIGVLNVRKGVKAIRQAVVHEHSRASQRLINEWDRHMVRGTSSILPVLSAIAAEEGLTDAQIDRMLDGLSLDGLA